MKQFKSPVKAYSKHSFQGLGFQGFHTINYLEWGAAERKKRKDTLVCVHGVSRNARDFDFFAAAMCNDYRVICPDVVGRGDSDHLESPEGYDYLQYNADMNALLARLNVTGVDWLGTSMGGIIGMVLAASHQTPIRRLILNDIGPEIQRDSLVKMGEYMGRAPDFDTPDDAEAYFRDVYSEFGPMTDADWKHLTKYALRQTSAGKFRIKMDKGVGDAFRDDISMFDVDMWDVWERISCPVLILRGKQSSFFKEETAKKMLTCGPESTLVEFDGCGHTPSLRDEEQVDVIRNWLAET